VIREARAADLAPIAEIAIATGQQDDWSGRNPAYIEHLMRVGRVLVAADGGRVTGFGAVQDIGTVRVLCDLFVDPVAHGTGVGRALLAELWRDAPRRMTFSSLHAHALPLYTSFGLDAWWPLLYLRGDARALRFPAGWATADGTAEEVGALERDWTGIDRTADHGAWAARRGGRSVLVLRDGVVVAAGTAAGPEEGFWLVHLAMRPPAGDEAAGDEAAGDEAAGDEAAGDEAAAAVVAALAGLASPAVGVCLPAPHPAVRVLLAAGWRVDEFDLFMASEPGLLDPRCAVPSPGQA
jgi:GNAT superfamily N-acetyltransferase